MKPKGFVEEGRDSLSKPEGNKDGGSAAKPDSKVPTSPNERKIMMMKKQASLKKFQSASEERKSKGEDDEDSQSKEESSRVEV